MQFIKGTLAKLSKEYSYNTSTTVTNDLTSFAYGYNGALLPTGSPAGNFYKRVRFANTIQDGFDEIKLMLITVSGARKESCLELPRIVSGTSEYGMWWEKANSTDIDVYFGKDGATPDTSWTDLNSAGWFWYVSKVKWSGFVEKFMNLNRVLNDDGSNVYSSGTYTFKNNLGTTILSATPSGAVTIGSISSQIVSSDSHIVNGIFCLQGKQTSSDWVIPVGSSSSNDTDRSTFFASLHAQVGGGTKGRINYLLYGRNVVWVLGNKENGTTSDFVIGSSSNADATKGLITNEFLKCSSGGGWTIGAAGYTGNHNVNGNLYLKRQDTGLEGGQISFEDSNGTTGYIVDSYGTSGSNGLRFIRSGFDVVGTISPTGSWTFGTSSTSSMTDSHIFYSRSSASSGQFGLKLQFPNGSLGIHYPGANTPYFPVNFIHSLVAGGNEGIGFVVNTSTASGYIAPQGNWIIGPTTTLTASHTIQNAASVTTDYVLYLNKRGTAAGSSRIIAAGGNSSVQGYIRTNSTANNLEFEGSSDRRIKTNIIPIPNALSSVMSLNPVQFEMKANLGVKGLGFIAQEFAEVFPQQVTRTDDGIGDELPNGIEPWTMSDSILPAVLTKAIQELNEKLDVAISRIATLEGK